MTKLRQTKHRKLHRPHCEFDLDASPMPPSRGQYVTVKSAHSCSHSNEIIYSWIEWEFLFSASCSHLRAWSRERPVKLKKLRYSSATIRLKSLLRTETQTGINWSRKTEKCNQKAGKPAYQSTKKHKVLVRSSNTSWVWSVSQLEIQTGGQRRKKEKDWEGSSFRRRGNPLILNSF